LGGATVQAGSYMTAAVDFVPSQSPAAGASDEANNEKDQCF